MLSGRDDPGESRMGEISMSGSTREREAAVIGLWAFHPVLSSLLYWFESEFDALRPVIVRASSFVVFDEEDFSHRVKAFLIKRKTGIKQRSADARIQQALQALDKVV